MTTAYDRLEPNTVRPVRTAQLVGRAQFRLDDGTLFTLTQHRGLASKGYRSNMTAIPTEWLVFRVEHPDHRRFCERGYSYSGRRAATAASDFRQTVEEFRAAPDAHELAVLLPCPVRPVAPPPTAAPAPAMFEVIGEMSLALFDSVTQ